MVSSIDIATRGVKGFMRNIIMTRMKILCALCARGKEVTSERLDDLHHVRETLASRSIIAPGDALTRVRDFTPSRISVAFSSIVPNNGNIISARGTDLTKR